MCDSCGCGSSDKEKSFEQKVREVIDSVRPALQGHGGDIELIGVDSDKSVRVRLQGACSGCPGAKMTLKLGVERMLKSKVPEVKEVIPVD
jgi:Fe-S cluster biogenesis protein NfuA